MSKKILSVCLCLVLSVALTIPAFAVGEAWYNVQFPTEKGVYQNSKGLISSYVSPEEKHVYITDSTKFTGSWISFALNSNWAISYSPAYDYWITFQCYGVGLDSISEFSFYPTTFEVRYYDIHTDTYKNHNISDISFGHFDSSQRAGFSCFAKLPDNFNATIHEFVVNGNSGTFPKNLRAVVQLYQVPKNDDGSSVAAAQVIAAIQDQTDRLEDLIQGNGGDSAAESVNSEINSAISDIDNVEQDIHDQAEEAFRASDSLINQFDPSSFTSAGNLYKELSESAFSSLGSVAVFIFIPLILFCAGAFIGKLK